MTARRAADETGLAPPTGPVVPRRSTHARFWPPSRRRGRPTGQVPPVGQAQIDQAPLPRPGRCSNQPHPTRRCHHHLAAARTPAGRQPTSLERPPHPAAPNYQNQPTGNCPAHRSPTARRTPARRPRRRPNRDHQTGQTPARQTPARQALAANMASPGRRRRYRRLRSSRSRRPASDRWRDRSQGTSDRRSEARSRPAAGLCSCDAIPLTMANSSVSPSMASRDFYIMRHERSRCDPIRCLRSWQRPTTGKVRCRCRDIELSPLSSPGGPKTLLAVRDSADARSS
jgi:hypothetical protein